MSLLLKGLVYKKKLQIPFIAKANLVKKANYMNSNQEKLKGYLTL